MGLFSTILNILMTHYFSLLMIFSSLILFVVYGLEVPGKFPREQKIAKWGSLAYLAIAVLFFIVSRFAG